MGRCRAPDQCVNTRRCGRGLKPRRPHVVRLLPRNSKADARRPAADSGASPPPLFFLPSSPFGSLSSLCCWQDRRRSPSLFVLFPTLPRLSIRKAWCLLVFLAFSTKLTLPRPIHDRERRVGLNWHSLPLEPTQLPGQPHKRHGLASPFRTRPMPAV